MLRISMDKIAERVLKIIDVNKIMDFAVLHL